MTAAPHLPVLDPSAWRDRAACVALGVDPEVFFPDRGGSARPAKRVCARCPVRAACLADALATPVVHDEGIRGGLTPSERRALRGRAW